MVFGGGLNSYILPSNQGADDVEKLQFDDIDTAISALTFYSVASWQLLAISYLVKEDKEYQPKIILNHTK
jgi:hypothetical protein